MDFRNNSIPIEKITSMDINKAIQRSTTKAIAMHGLGLQLWTGEDIPTNVPETTPKNEPAPESELAELTEKSEDWSKVTNYVSDNYKMGIDKIGKQLNRRYKMSATIKKKIASIIEARLSLDEANGEETN
jgi:hypothetical protein